MGGGRGRGGIAPRGGRNDAEGGWRQHSGGLPQRRQGGGRGLGILTLVTVTGEVEGEEEEEGEERRRSLRAAEICAAEWVDDGDCQCLKQRRRESLDVRTM